MKKYKFSILTLFSFLFVLVGCGSAPEGTYNSYGSRSNFSSWDSLTTITFDKDSVKMTVQYYDLDAANVTEKSIVLTGSVNANEKTMTFQHNGNAQTLQYEMSDGKLVVDGKEFAISTSEDYTSNKTKFSEARSKLVQSLQKNIETSSSTTSSKNNQATSKSSDAQREVQARQVSQKIVDDLKSKITGNWQSGHFNTPWKDGSKLSFNENNSFVITHVAPLPEYLSWDITYAGTYKFDIEKLTAQLLQKSEVSTSGITFGKRLDLSKINSYDDYIEQGVGSSLVPVTLNYAKTGRDQGGPLNEENLTAFIEVGYKNNSLELSTTQFFYKTSFSLYTRE